MPKIDEVIDQLGNAQYLSTLDLTKGYWQVPVSADAQRKTAFTTSFGLFEFRRMPFGLQGAPTTFQRMMDKLLDGLGDFAKAYIGCLQYKLGGALTAPTYGVAMIAESGPVWHGGVYVPWAYSGRGQGVDETVKDCSSPVL